MIQEMQTAIHRVIQQLFEIELEIELSRTDEQFGDYATNVAMRLAGRVGKSPREIAENLAAALRDELASKVDDITIAGPGFINFRLRNDVLAQVANMAPRHMPEDYDGQTIVVEYSDPNPFKVLHAGHLYTSVVGYAISNLFELAGAKVHRVNFGGDVGMHVGKTMWAIVRELGGEHPDKLSEIAEDQHAEWMAQAYVIGTNAYEDDEVARAEIVTLNKRVYKLFADNDHESDFARIYWTCRAWSYEYFSAFYDRIGTPFERYYPESEVADLGLKTVRQQLEAGVYAESDGAVVFRGEAYGVHTRVFINSQGIPTYEAKDVGLIMKKYEDYHFDRSVVITGNEQEQYMAVVLKSIEQYAPELVEHTTHLTHGMVKLEGGVKMSSRKGNILRAVDVLDVAAEASVAATGNSDDKTVLGAVKYAFIKQRMGADIVYDPDESVSLEGNSGPYLQYAHARACSILAKVENDHSQALGADLDSSERSLARKISEYPEVINKAIAELMPHYVCTYLYELAQSFNRFYETCKVVGDPRQVQRSILVKLYADVLKAGLGVLGIAAPDHM